jgi:hypothetical protein
LVLSFETYFERSCRYVERAWRFLLGVSRIILCYVNDGKFGVALVLLDLLFAIFVFCLIWSGLQVGTWGGVVDGCRHIVIADGQSLLRLGFNSPNNA